MRFGLWGLAALLLGILSAHFLLQERGYVLINFRGYVIEMSVPVLLLVLILAYVLVRFVVHAWRAPRRLGEAVAGRRARKAGDALTRGLIHMTEGNWARSERLLTRGIRRTDAPLVNYLMAARVAHEQGEAGRRNEWLKLAYEELPEAEAAVLLTQAELQFDDRDYEPALATLKRFTDAHPDHPIALGLLARTYSALGDRAELRALLPKLGVAHLSAGERETLAVEALSGIDASSDFSLAELKETWSSLPPELRLSPRLLTWRAHALDRLGAGDRAENELRAELKRRWDPSLARAYGEVLGSDPRKQLRQVERWLKDRPDDGVLLLTAARLCLANELWGKARSYLESSLALAPDPATYALYGRLLTQLGENDGAANAYRSGLGLISEADLDLPVLEAPPESGEASS